MYTPIISELRMREIGFSDHREDYWYICKRVGSDTTLNICINKKTGEYTEHVLNESFGQPEYYGRMKEPYRTNIRDAVDREIQSLSSTGLDIRVDHGEYGFGG